MNNLKGPRWQECPVKPASFSPLMLNSLKLPIFVSPSMFGHSCCCKTVALSLLQVPLGRSQPAPKGSEVLSLTLG